MAHWVILYVASLNFDPRMHEKLKFSCPPQAGANGRGGNNDATYASGSLSLSSDGCGGGGDANAPARADFMISFLVDARGGTMHGTRFSGVTVQRVLTRLAAFELSCCCSSLPRFLPTSPSRPLRTPHSPFIPSHSFFQSTI